MRSRSGPLRVGDRFLNGDRITKLRNTGDLEAVAYAHLKHLGELKRPYLTQLEEKLLRLLEQEYKIITN